MKRVKSIESHITVMLDETVPRERISHMVAPDGWKLSNIDGDPNLGAGVRTYLTKHTHKTVDEAVEDMDFLANLLRGMGVKVVRKKVELIAYDEIL